MPPPFTKNWSQPPRCFAIAPQWNTPSGYTPWCRLEIEALLVKP